VFGTGNPKKAGELAELLRSSGIELKTLVDFDDPLEVDESGRRGGRPWRRRSGSSSALPC
jgi:inosine/xanthosine triphosphate pyrophosphatase family protein